MHVEASSRFVRVAPSKVRPVARLLKGLPVADALKATAFGQQKAAGLIGKVLKSAIASVEHTHKLEADAFWVDQVLVEQGPTLKRHWARSRGMARPVARRTSHIRVILANE